MHCYNFIVNCFIIWCTVIISSEPSLDSVKRRDLIYKKKSFEPYTPSKEANDAVNAVLAKNDENEMVECDTCLANGTIK